MSDHISPEPKPKPSLLRRVWRVIRLGLGFGLLVLLAINPNASPPPAHQTRTLIGYIIGLAVYLAVCAWLIVPALRKQR